MESASSNWRGQGVRPGVTDELDISPMLRKKALPAREMGGECFFHPAFRKRAGRLPISPRVAARVAVTAAIIVVVVPESVAIAVPVDAARSSATTPIVGVGRQLLVLRRIHHLGECGSGEGCGHHRTHRDRGEGASDRLALHCDSLSVIRTGGGLSGHRAKLRSCEHIGPAMQPSGKG